MQNDEPRLKILVLTDSAANPRSFPPSMVVQVEETYPYLLRRAFPSAVFYQLSFGNIVTEDLVSQAVAYLTHWKPDFIVVQSGLADCRPEAFSEAEKAVIKRLPDWLFGNLKKNLYHPAIIRRRQLHRVSPEGYRKSARKLKMVFAKSQVLWLEICAGVDYEQERPGVGSRMAEYNLILRGIFGDNVVATQDLVHGVNGFNQDQIHWVVSAHRAVGQRLIERIRDLLHAPEGSKSPLAAQPCSPREHAPHDR
jgi:hypothetical protein